MYVGHPAREAFRLSWSLRMRGDAKGPICSRPLFTAKAQIAVDPVKRQGMAVLSCGYGLLLSL